MQRELCATVLYTYLHIEQYTSIAMVQMMNVLGKVEETRCSVKGFLRVHEHRKIEIKQFIKDYVLENTTRCSLFSPWGPAVLTDQQKLEVSTYIGSLSNELSEIITKPLDQDECPCKFQ